IESDSLLPIGNATVGENLSAKGCLPVESNKNNQYYAVDSITIFCPYRAFISWGIEPAAMRRASLYCPFRAEEHY
ncbi:MAG: hypothetical protein LBG58_15050, partial [Planctomycetaceae bacterium]|nr:hypothetical protein [Planctomycetaceae bacterium]